MSVLSNVNFISRFSNCICCYQLCTASVPVLPRVIGVFPSKCQLSAMFHSCDHWDETRKESKEDSSNQKEGNKQIEGTVTFSLLNDVFLKF